MMTAPVKLVGSVLLTAILFGAAIPSRADPGNVVSWFSNQSNELTFTCQTAVVKLNLLEPHVARVRLAPAGAMFSTNASFTVVTNWPLPAVSVVDSNPLLIATSEMKIDVAKTPFRLTFRRLDGTVLLTDSNTVGLSYTQTAMTTNRTANFLMPVGEQFYGLGLVLGQPLTYRNQVRTLYNARVGFESGAMTDMAVPLVVSSKDYGLFMDNTYSQTWDFTRVNGTQWRARVAGGQLDYYFIAGDTTAEVLDRYTQLTGRSPMPPRWVLGYSQSKFGYRNWSQVFAAKDAFRTNDLPCDMLVLDLYWFGQATDIGKLTWDLNSFSDPATNISALASAGFQIMAIHEPYINTNNATANYNEAKTLHYLVSNDAAMTVPSTVQNGLFGTLAYFDFLNPTARGWWFEKLRPMIDDGVAAHWTDLGEPEQDDPADFLFGGRREAEIHNVYNLLWHRALAEGYATNYPNQRLFMLSRSGFAGDQRYGAAHWSNDIGADWPTLAAHPNALANYGMSGLSYFGSDIGGFTGLPTDELYVRWFQFGAFCPVFRAHGVDDKPTAPYEFSSFVRDHCRNMMKLRYRLLPYIYNCARETYDTGLPMCRALPLAFPNDPAVFLNGTQFMFGPSIMVAPMTSEGLTSRSVYLPAGKWIDHWTGQTLTGPVTTNWPAPISQIPLFYRDNSIIPLGPQVASSQFDDGSQRTLRIYCGSAASYTLYDDDGNSNGYRSNEFAKTVINASRSGSVVSVNIDGAVGSYSSQPAHRSWQLELFCTNALFNVIADGIRLNALPSNQALATSASGYYVDAAEKLLRIKLGAAPFAQPHSVSAYLDTAAPPPYEVRLNGGGRPYLDRTGAMWVEDRPYSAGWFGSVGGGSNTIENAIAGTEDDLLYQSEHLGTNFSMIFDLPNGVYETQLLNAETKWQSPGNRLFDVTIEGRQVLTNFDLIAIAGPNTAVTLTFTNPVSDGQLNVDFAFAGSTGSDEHNARLSAIRVRKIADVDTDGDGIPDWWETANGLNPNDPGDAGDDPDGDGKSNLEEFHTRTNPHDPASTLSTKFFTYDGSGFAIAWSSVPGKRYRVHWSNDLLDWSDIETDVVALSNLETWTDPAPLPSNRFYRVEALP